MIRRRWDESFLLITQDEHARLSGELARRVGNADFARPTPLEEVIAGIALHDSGWPLMDGRPALNGAGLPQHVFETHVGDFLIFQVWETSVDWAAERSAYAGLLVSLHVMHLSLRAQASIGQIYDDSFRQARFKLNQFHHRQIERQESFRRLLGMRTDLPLRFGLSESGRSAEEDLLLCNFRLLQAMDQISLNLCFDEVRFEKIEPVNARAGLPATALRMSRGAAGEFRMDPWPFDGDELRLEVEGRRVSAEPFANAEVLAAALSDAVKVAVPLSIGR